MIRPKGAGDDVHGRAMDWITRFDPSEPPRDVAVHARYCDECRRAIRAVDLLLGVDVGRAPMPGAEPIPVPAKPLAPRLAVGGASLFVLVMAGLTVLDGLQTAATAPSSSPAQGVLGGAGSAVPSPLPEDAETAAATPSASEPTPRPQPPLATLAPSLPFFASVTPGFTAPGQPTATPPPSASAEATREPISPEASPTTRPPTPTPPPASEPASPSGPASETASPSEPASEEASPDGG